MAFKSKHGMYKTEVYKRWVYMKSRCKVNHAYVIKGITVCPEWIDDFMQFYRDMGEPPEGHTLDRIDGTKGYSKDNCRWATYKTQNQNLSTNVRVADTVLAEVARELGMHRNTIKYRIDNNQPIDAPIISERMQCKAGHEWNEENTYVTKAKRKQGGYRTQRFCRVCRAKHQADLRKRRT